MEKEIYRWVKASDRMPTKEGRYCVKRLFELMIADAVLRKNDVMVFATPNNMTWNGYKDFEWLEEVKEADQQDAWEDVRTEIDADHDSVSPRALKVLKSKYTLIPNNL